MEETENVEDTELSETATQCRSTLSLNSEIEDAEAETNKRKPTQVIGETTKRRRTPLNPEFGEDAEASETSKLLSKPVDGDASKPVDRDAYGKIPLAFTSPELYQAVAESAPPDVRAKSEKEIAAYVNEIIMRYAPSQKEMELREYRDKIISEYPRLHEKLYAIHPTEIFVPSFIKAINEKTEDRFKNIISQPFPGILTFEIFQPEYCEMLVAEVNHFQTWIHKADIRTEHRNNMNNMTYLDDLGMGCMLQNLMDSFISPISKVFFTQVGGSTLDEHECVVEYHTDGENELVVQVDDTELTLNVCLGQRFSGGELCFQGVYCEKHVDTPTRPESDSIKYYEILGVPNSASQDDLKKAYPKSAIKNNPDKGGDPVKEAFEYSHIVGQAILYQGRNRHVSRVTTAGKRFNLVLGCKSTAFRGMCKLMSDFSWCSKCKQEKERRNRETVSTFMAGIGLK
ncbi:hypothetical protein H5410_024668 [Solanum commersonii]|uniref:J domain-containing protein n=1 Tax=Solanum commersonii TaxID=4109 RepID=A0A9J5ZMM2_SOLCO|nr:hypothetical protein H5410_024668 [Solanum commersonii]